MTLLLPILFFTIGIALSTPSTSPIATTLRTGQDVTTGRVDNDSYKILDEWQAGSVVTDADVEGYGLERCFAACPISDKVFARMKGKSYKSYCHLPLTQLRYVKVLHRNAMGQTQLGELVCHRDIAADLVSIFRTLYQANYPIERMVLIDNYNAEDEPSMLANNTSCFNYRYIAGSKRLSNHSSGRAIDINPLYNPYVYHNAKGKLIVSPMKAKAYANRHATFPYKIDKSDLCYREFIKHGFIWGGSWKRRIDYQHFEKR
uniref:M15 family metallopeptidase n=1 Tax=Alloprevotella sp. TaxID=1872471 RepID=UPI003FEFC9BC